jgi:transposase
MPSRPIERGRPEPGFLAHVLVSKYADHLPLYRQSQIYAREGVDSDRSTMADWVGKSTILLEPGNKKTKTARIWAYVRDERLCCINRVKDVLPLSPYALSLQVL